MSTEMITLDERPAIAEQMVRLNDEAWPEFMHHDAIANRYWSVLMREFGEWQFALLEADEVVAVGHSLPVTWDGTSEGLPETWDAALEQGVTDGRQGRSANTLCASAAIVALEHRGRGLSEQVINGMKRLAAERGFRSLIVPVRPTWKVRYPLTPMERYVEWRRPDGAPLDPWLRVHWRLGGEVLRVAHCSMLIEGTVAEWEQWTGMAFPESGDYVVPGALQPVAVDRERDIGRYEEPNVWVHHRIGT